MRSPKFYKTVIAVLVVLNLSTIAFFLFMKPPHPPKPGEHLLSDKLELTGTHKTEVDKLEKEHHKLKRALVEEDEQLHQKLFDLIGKDGSTEDIMKQIDEKRREIESMTFEFFDAVAKQCNESQKKELREFVKETLRGLHPKPGPPRDR